MKPSLALPALLILASLACAHARAEDLSAACSALLQEKSLLRQGEPSRLKLLFQLIFDRDSFISPLSIGDEAPDDAQATKPASGERIRIFTLGQPEPVSRQERILLKQLRSAEKRQLKAVNRILEATTPRQCAEIAREIGWAPGQLQDLETLAKTALPATRHEESQLSWKLAQKVAAREPQTRWEIAPVDSWGEIVQSLRADPPSGMILIAHADPYGRLYDSLRDELPSGFFRGLPPSVRFIGIYSCESEQVIRSYGLNRLSGRQVVTVKLANPFAAEETTPLQFFPIWAGKLEKEGLLAPSAGLTEGEEEAECPLRLSGMKIRQGRLAVTIRGLPVGVWDKESADQPRLVPCSWLADASPLTVFAQPSRSGETVSLESSPVSAMISEGGSVVTLSHETLYRTGSGALRSLVLAKF